MKYRVDFLDTETGRRASVDYDEPWWDQYGREEMDDHLDFCWTEHNNGCDCNRGDYLARALGEPDPDLPCGSSRIAIRLTLVDGRVVVDEEAFVPA